jgi:hypothetical protein
MDLARALDLMSECEELVLAESLHTKLDDPRRQQLDRCLDVIRCARAASPDKLAEVVRWLGFVQGVLWTWGTPLERFLDPNAPASDGALEPDFVDRLKAELHARLSSGKLTAAELVQMGELAGQIDEIEERHRREAAHMESLRQMVQQVGEKLVPALLPRT